MNGRFKIYFRRRQNQNQGVDVLIQCDPATGYAQYIPGTVDNTTPFDGIVPVDGWYDFTDYIDQAENMTLTWDKTNTGGSVATGISQDGSNYDKGVSSEYMLFDKAHAFVYDWLLSYECNVLNCVEVLIVDAIAGGTYRIFEIKADNLDYAPIDEPCQFYVRLREQDNIWHCIHKNFIWDNFQNWFDDSTVKSHPCFLTCIEPRPRLLSSARMAIHLFWHSAPIFGVFNQFIPNFLNFIDGTRRILNANRFVDSPLVSTYINNIAAKCNLKVDTIFDEGKDFENLCIFYPLGGFMHESIDSAATSPQLFYHIDNRWMVTLAELMDKLKVVFCAEWYVTPNGTIQFKYLKDLISLDPIYDFTAVGAEPIYGLKYTFNGNKKAGYGRYEYMTDGSDLASQEMDTLYNDIVDYDGPEMNPMLEGEKNKTFDFSPTGFIRDGRARDYLKDVIDDGIIGGIFLVLWLAVLGALLLPQLVVEPKLLFFYLLIALTAVSWAGSIWTQSGILKNEFVNSPKYTGAVRITSEQTLQPRLLLWDGLSMERAKVVVSTGLPAINPFYNKDGVPYDVANELNIAGVNPQNTIFNYPLYFDSMYYGNLFPLYHDVIDNPLKSLETNQNVTFDVDLCEGMLNLFGVFQTQYAQIGKVIKIEHRQNYDVYGRITNINVDYQNNKINIKAVVIRRKSPVDFPQIIPPTYTSQTNTIPPVVYPTDSGPIFESQTIPPNLFPPEPTPPFVFPCMVWQNQSGVGKYITYRDISGAIVTVYIDANSTFQSTEIIDTGDIAGIVAIAFCPTSSTTSSTTYQCYYFVNVGSSTSVGVTYIDCDGNPVTADIPVQSGFCAMEVTNYGSCPNIVQTGPCQPCTTVTPTCYVVDYDYAKILDYNGDRVVWCADPLTEP